MLEDKGPGGPSHLLRAFASLRLCVRFILPPGSRQPIRRPLCCTMATLSCWARKGRSSMNLEKFTDRAKGFLQAAQTIAIRMNHQRISPEHVAKALLEDNQGMAAGLIANSGGDTARAVAGIDRSEEHTS